MISKLSIIVPSYNEERTVIQLLSMLVELNLINNIKKEILIINDFSSDQTEVLVTDFIRKHSSLDIKLYNQKVNLGKGAALHVGISLANGDYLIPQDADLELNPNDINKLLQKAIDHKLDVVYGTRFHNDNQINKTPAYYANIFLTRLSNLFTGLKLSDMETCYKLIKTSIAKELNLKEKRFGFEPEITSKLAKQKGIKVDEAPISYISRTYTEGKKIGWRDGLKAMYCIFKYAF